MGMSPVDAGVNLEIFRKDHPIIIAHSKQKATIEPVRLKLESGGYLAGQVLCKNTVSGLFEKNSGASGTYDAVAVLLEDISLSQQPAAGSALARAAFGGFLFADKCIDLDSNAKTKLKASVYSAADNVNILKF